MQCSAELEDLVTRWFASASRGDESMVDTVVSSDAGTCLIGSDPDEWVRGGAEVADFLRGEVRNAGGQALFTPEGTEAYEEGTVGWASTRLTRVPRMSHHGAAPPGADHRRLTTVSAQRSRAAEGAGCRAVGQCWRCDGPPAAGW